jgi:hypothetical protein
MIATPRGEQWSSPWTATTVPATMTAMDATRMGVARSRREQKRRHSRTTGANAFRICTNATLLWR